MGIELSLGYGCVEFESLGCGGVKMHKIRYLKA